MFVNYKLIILLAAHMLFIIAVEGNTKKKKCMTLCRPGGMWYNGCIWCPCTKSGRRARCPKTDKPCHYLKPDQTTTPSTEITTGDDSISGTTAELEICSTKDMTDIEINSDGQITGEMTTSNSETSEITEELQANSTIKINTEEADRSNSVNTAGVGEKTDTADGHLDTVHTSDSFTTQGATDGTDNSNADNSTTNVSDGSGPVSDGSGPVSDGSGPVSDGSGPASDDSGRVSDGSGPVSDGSGPVSEATANGSLGEGVTGDYSPSDSEVGSDATETSNMMASDSSDDGVTPNQGVSDSESGSNAEPASNDAVNNSPGDTITGNAITDDAVTGDQGASGVDNSNSEPVSNGGADRVTGDQSPPDEGKSNASEANSQINTTAAPARKKK